MSWRHRSARTVALLLLGVLALTVIPARVTLAGNGTTTCRVRNVTQGTSSGNFRVVVVLAHDGDRLEVRGTCHPRGIAIDRDLVIRGLGDGATLDGQAKYRVLRIRQGAVVTLRHLTITHGLPRSYLHGDVLAGGGAITNRGTLTLVDSHVTENEAYFGGGIYNIGTLTLIRSSVSGHGAGWPDDEGSTIQGTGGGIFNAGSATLEDSVVSDNHTDYDGGGIKNTGTLTLRRSRVSGNSSDFGAPGGQGPGSGGIVNSGTLILVDSEVTGNNGATGAGIGNTGSVRLTRSLVADNSASYGGGGGIYNAGTVRLTGSTVSGNTVTVFAPAGGGGGIFNDRRGTAVLTGGSRVTGNSSVGGCVGDGCSQGGGTSYAARGGGVLNRGSLTLRDSTVTANTATDQGGGIFNRPSGTVALHGSSSVSGNTPDDCVGTPAC